MAEFNLYWNPGNPYETGLTQQVQYKMRSQNSYTVLATLPGFKDSYRAAGLQDDTIYNFRIANNCNNSYSPVINAISFDCPDVALFRDDNQVDYSFSADNGKDIDRYFVKLYSGGIFVTQEAYNAPFLPVITGSFMGLDGVSDYTVVVTLRADELVGTCDPLSDLPVVCVSITDVNASTAP